MSYTSKTWKDRISEYPSRRSLEKADGTSEIVSVTRAEGQISQEGDAFSAQNMNNLESRIFNGFEGIGVQYDEDTDKIQVRANDEWVDVLNAGAKWDGTLLDHANTYDAYTGGYICGKNVEVTENGLYFKGAESASWNDDITVRTGLIDTVSQYYALHVVMTSAPTNYLRIAFETESGTEYMLFDSTNANRNKTVFDLPLNGLPSGALRLKILGKNNKYIQSLKLLKANKGFTINNNFIQCGFTEEISIASGSPKNIDIVFDTAFSEKPIVIASGERIADSSTAGAVTVTAMNVTNTGCTLRLSNTANSTYSYRANWMAIGT